MLKRDLESIKSMTIPFYQDNFKIKWNELSVSEKQNLIMDYFINSSNAAKATGQLRKFQLECLELLKNFEKICNQNNLVYWLDFGSLLGAIRHKGFIICLMI